MCRHDYMSYATCMYVRTCYMYVHVTCISCHMPHAHVTTHHKHMYVRTYVCDMHVRTYMSHVEWELLQGQETEEFQIMSHATCTCHMPHAHVTTHHKHMYVRTYVTCMYMSHVEWELFQGQETEGFQEEG